MLASSILAEPTITAIDQLPIDLASQTIHELSGLTYAGGDQYFAVSDKDSTLVPLTIKVDLTTGKIKSAEPGKPLTIDNVTDLEGVAYDPRDKSVLIAAEGRQVIKRINPQTGEHLAWVDVPAVLKKNRPNLGLESLTLDPIHFHLWTANEEALRVDGPRSTAEEGSSVRLQRFDAQGVAAAQYAYQTDPHQGSGQFSDRTPSRSGVVDLVALPSGDLLVLERSLGGAVLPQLRTRIYAVDFEQASDTSKLESLDNANYTPVIKRRLIQIDAGLRNYEGITIGPRLNNGDYLLLLISDDGSNPDLTPQSILPLRLSGVSAPEKD